LTQGSAEDEPTPGQRFVQEHRAQFEEAAWTEQNLLFLFEKYRPAESSPAARAVSKLEELQNAADELVKLPARLREDAEAIRRLRGFRLRLWPESSPSESFAPFGPFRPSLLRELPDDLENFARQVELGLPAIRRGPGRPRGYAERAFMREFAVLSRWKTERLGRTVSPRDDLGALVFAFLFGVTHEVETYKALRARAEKENDSAK
jgi:hypothetical protein